MITTQVNLAHELSKLIKDKRTLANIDRLCMHETVVCAKVFEASQGTGGSANGNGGTKAFFSEIIASITDMKFVGSGRFILSRDYMSLKLWDVAMDGRGPIATYWIHEHIRPRLGDLYESDNVFDKFECCASGGYHSPRTSPTDASSVIPFTTSV